MERPLDDLIGYMRTVVVTGINVVHAGLDRLPQNSNSLVNVAWRSPNPGTGKLHCSVAHAVQGHRSAWQREAAGEVNLWNHFCSPTNAHYLSSVAPRR